MMVTAVKTRIALFCDSETIASSFCSIDRSWKSYHFVNLKLNRNWGKSDEPHSLIV